MDFARRSREAEIIDDPAGLDRSQLETILRELRLVNRWLGGQSSLLAGIRDLLSDSTTPSVRKIVDLGTGSGDIPLAIARWARKNAFESQIVALDLNESICRLADQHVDSDNSIHVVCGDIRNLPLREKSVDVISCSAFLHHFEDRELRDILKDLLRISRHGIIISDLHRHVVAHFSIRMLTRLFSRSRAVRHDGPLSVRRGFKRTELEDLLRSVGCPRFDIKWKWAFRWLVTIRVPTPGSPG